MKEVSHYLEEIRRVRYDFEKKKNIQLLVGNVDETCLKFDMTRGTTYDFQGAKEIRIRKTLGNKLTFTAILAVMMDGTKLPPLLIFKSKHPIASSLKQKYKDYVMLYANPSGWCVENIFKDWITNIWLNLDLKPGQKSLLAMDNFSVHKKDTIQDLLKSGNSLCRFIPPGCTGLLQPLDTHLNKPFKDTMRKKFDVWYENYGCKPVNATPKGNLRAPSIDTVIQWVIDVWESIPEQLIKNSFQHCGI